MLMRFRPGRTLKGILVKREKAQTLRRVSDIEETTGTNKRAKSQDWTLDELLKMMVDKNASDLHLTVSSPPILRIDGSLVPVPEMPPLEPADLTKLFKQATITKQRTAFKKEKELDFAYSLEGVARFRVNALFQRGSISLAFRRVLVDIPSIEGLGLPAVLKEVIMKPRGLILVTGPANSGKSTTMAAMIRHLNENASKNVITIEDPVEYLHPNNKCIIRQRDLGDDTLSFHAALVHALRHDPDVVIIGEMRDLDTISTAMTAAETGHLVVGTLHTVDAAQSIDRIIDMYPVRPAAAGQAAAFPGDRGGGVPDAAAAHRRRAGGRRGDHAGQQCHPPADPRPQDLRGAAQYRDGQPGRHADAGHGHGRPGEEEPGLPGGSDGEEQQPGQAE